MNKRHFMLLLALLITLWLAFGALPSGLMQSSQSPVLPVRQLPTIAEPEQRSLQQLAPLLLANRHIAASQFDLFATPPITKQSPALKPVTSTRAALKPQSIAPKPPIQYLGRIQTGDVAGVMLEVNGEVTQVQIGDVLLGQYQVKSINHASQVQLLYLPLNVMQTIN